jgi:predicted metal-binding protein
MADVKRESTFKMPRFSPEEIEAIIAAAPEHMDDPDCPYDPDDPVAFEACWSNAKMILPDEHAFQKEERNSRTRKSTLTKKQLEAAVAATPEYVDDPDCPYNPNNEAKVNAR